MTDANSPSTTFGQPPAQFTAAYLEAALTALDAQLNPRDYATTMVLDDPPGLAISSRRAQIADDVYTDGRFYYWSWGQPIAAVGNPRAAAEKISYVLGGPGNPHA